MPFTQIRPVAGQMAKHVTAARRFSTAPILRKEIQDAYILSAARTPTAKVRDFYSSKLTHRRLTHCDSSTARS